MHCASLLGKSVPIFLPRFTFFRQQSYLSYNWMFCPIKYHVALRNLKDRRLTRWTLGTYIKNLETSCNRLRYSLPIRGSFQSTNHSYSAFHSATDPAVARCQRLAASWPPAHIRTPTRESTKRLYIGVPFPVILSCGAKTGNCKNKLVYA